MFRTKHQTKRKIIAVANQKGGVGKTTTAVNLATALAAVGNRTLLIDADPQGNASTGLGIEQHMRHRTVYDIFVDYEPVDATLVPTTVPGLKLVPSTVDLAAIDIELSQIDSREFVLRHALDDMYEAFDYIIIDCPPSLGLLTVNALAAATELLIPLQCEFYALEGLSHLLQTYHLVKERLNPNLDIAGVVLTMYDARSRLAHEVEDEVRKFFGDKVFKTRIPRNVKLSEAPSYGKPAVIYDHRCSGSMAYLYLAKEILKLEHQQYKQQVMETA